MSDLLLSPSLDPSWLLVEEGINPAREREIESILAIGNGYIGTRASVAEDRGFSHPSTFAAGIYVTDAGLELGPRLAVLPNWLHVDVTVEGQQLSLEAGRVLEHRRLLDLRQGVLWREWRQQDPSGRITRLTYFQLASIADRHLLLQSVMVTAENYAGSIGLTSRLVASDDTRTETAEIGTKSRAMLLRVSKTEVAIASTSPRASRRKKRLTATRDQSPHRQLGFGAHDLAPSCFHSASTGAMEHERRIEAPASLAS